MGNSGAIDILVGIFVGFFLALLNAYLLYLTVIKTIKLEKKKAYVVTGIIYLFKFSCLFAIFFAIIKFTSINLIAVALSLGIITLFTPYKVFIRNINAQR